MKPILLILITLIALTGLSAPSSAWAQNPVIIFNDITKCPGWQWDEVTSEPLSGYRLYFKRGGADLPPVDIPPEDITSACINWYVINIARDIPFEVYVTALDLAGIESFPSNIVRFIYISPVPIPENFCMTTEAADGSLIARC